MEGIRYVEITSEEARALYKRNFEIMKVVYFKGGFEIKPMNRIVNGEKLFLTLNNIDYMVREDIFNSFYGIE